MQRDLPRASFEAPQHLRAGAQGQRCRPAGTASGHLHGLLDEEEAGRSRGRGLADHHPQGPHPAPVPVDADPALREADPDLPRGGVQPGSPGGDPAAGAVGAPRQPHPQPADAAPVDGLTQQRQRRQHPGDRAAGGDARDPPRPRSWRFEHPLRGEQDRDSALLGHASGGRRGRRRDGCAHQHSGDRERQGAGDRRAESARPAIWERGSHAAQQGPGRICPAGSLRGSLSR